MSMLLQRLFNAALIVAFASLYIWHGGRTVLFLMVVTLLIGASSVVLQVCGPRNIQIRRHMQSEQMVSGEDTYVQVELEFDSRIPLLWVVLCESTPAGVHRKCLFPGMRRHFSYQYQLSGLRRGVYEWGKGRLYWGDIFGWNTLSVETVSDKSLMVIPAIAGYGEDDSFTFGASGEGALSEQRHVHGKRSPEFREYQHGDPIARIHWKSTAKTGRLQTFLPEMTESPSIGILVYEGQSGYEQTWNGSSDHPAFERAISIAAGWVQKAELEDLPYHLWMGSGDVQFGVTDQIVGRVARGGEYTDYAMEQLAQAQVAPAISDIVSLADKTKLEYMPPGSRIVVLSGRMDHVLYDWVLYAASLGHVIEVQLTDGSKLSELNINAGTNRQQPVEKNATLTYLQSSVWLEQLQLSGVRVSAIADRSLPPLGKVVVTDVGA